MGFPRAFPQELPMVLQRVFQESQGFPKSTGVDRRAHVRGACCACHMACLSVPKIIPLLRSHLSGPAAGMADPSDPVMYPIRCSLCGYRLDKKPFRCYFCKTGPLVIEDPDSAICFQYEIESYMHKIYVCLPLMFLEFVAAVAAAVVAANPQGSSD